jgi:elongation factor G
MAIEPKTVQDQEKLELSLQKMEDEDPTFRVRVDEDTGQTIISGMGELHLEILVDRLKREFNVAANVGKPQVVYRETITTPSTSEVTIDREIAGEPKFARVTLSLEPLSRGVGFVVESLIKKDSLPDEWITSALSAIRDTATSGPILGYPLIDVKATLVKLVTKENLTDEMAFSIASGMALREAAQKGKPVLLEPIMSVEIITPEEFMGEIIGDMNARGGNLKGVEVRGAVNHIRADIPLSKMFGYSTNLRSQSQGRATFTMQFSHYDRAEAKQ